MKCSLTLILLILFFTSANAQTKKIDETLLLDYYQTQRFAEAADYLKKNFPEPVTGPKVLSSLAYSLQMSNKLAEAEGYYQRVYDLDTTNQSALLSMANINMQRGNHAKAETYYKRALTKDTTNFVVYKQLAFISANKNDTIPAINYLRNANRINPFDPETASELSGFYIQQKHFGLALKLLNRVAENDPDDIIILVSLVRLTYGEKQWQQCIGYCNKLMQISIASGDKPPGEVLDKLGMAYYNLKNYSCGVETFASIEGIAQTEYSYYYAALCYMGLKDNVQAINFMNKAISIGISPNIATYYGEIADSEEQLDKHKKAIQAYIKGLQFNEDPTIYYLLANLYDTKLKDKKSAVKYYKKFLALNKDAKKATYITYAQSRIEALKN